jgi:hypothetical protein
MKKVLLLFILLTLTSLNSIAQLTVAGTTLGERTHEVEEILTFKGVEGKYYMKSINNSSGICSYITMIPVNSEEDLRRLTVDQMLELMLFIRSSFGGNFGDFQEEDGIGYVNFKTDGCVVQLTFFDENSNGTSLEVQIYNENEFNKLKREISKSGLSFDEWADKH